MASETPATARNRQSDIPGPFTHCVPGFAVSLTVAVWLVSSTGMTDQTLRCPKCWLADRVQKVNALYASGPSIGRPDITNSSQPPLKQMLEPPPRPKQPRPPGVLVGLAAAALLIGGISLIVGLSDKSSELGTPDYGTVAAMGRAFTLAGIFALAVCAVIAVFIIVAYRRSRQRFTRQLTIWERKVEVWNRLCYCSRDNGVFLPGQGEFVPPEQTRDLLSRPVGRKKATTQVYLRH